MGYKFKFKTRKIKSCLMGNQKGFIQAIIWPDNLWVEKESEALNDKGKSAGMDS